jgi:hypothetical protein
MQVTWGECLGIGTKVGAKLERRRDWALGSGDDEKGNQDLGSLLPGNPWQCSVQTINVTLPPQWH